MAEHMELDEVADMLEVSDSDFEDVGSGEESGDHSDGEEEDLGRMGNGPYRFEPYAEPQVNIEIHGDPDSNPHDHGSNEQ